jgi:molybdenum cofactor synthesis domain-containing protein
MPFDQALAAAVGAVSPIARTEAVRLTDADGRVAAETIASGFDVPPFDRAAMDGYAVRSADVTSAGATLRVTARVFTGDWPADAVAAGACMEIATGAPMPPGADAVVMVEDTSPAGAGEVRIDTVPRAGQHIGRRAADIAAGAAVVSRGDVLTPSRVGALAAVGVTAVTVFARPAVAIVSTGNEIVQPGLPLGPGHIYDINRFTLESVVRRHGGTPVSLGSPGDRVDALERVLDAALAYDLVVFSGGSSVGDRDLVRDVIASRGTVLFHGIAVRPGKPTAFAMLGGESGQPVPFFGMPGNPTSCLSNAYLLLLPVLRALARLPAWEPRVVTRPLARRIASPNDRHQFYTVRLTADGAEPAFKGSGDITSMAHADGYIEIPAHTAAIEAGENVRITLF